MYAYLLRALQSVDYTSFGLPGSRRWRVVVVSFCRIRAPIPPIADSASQLRVTSCITLSALHHGSCDIRVYHIIQETFPTVAQQRIMTSKTIVWLTPSSLLIRCRCMEFQDTCSAQSYPNMFFSFAVCVLFELLRPETKPFMCQR